MTDVELLRGGTPRKIAGAGGGWLWNNVGARSSYNRSPQTNKWTSFQLTLPPLQQPHPLVAPSALRVDPILDVHQCIGGFAAAPPHADESRLASSNPRTPAVASSSKRSQSDPPA
eukprot:4851960-Prymnesium_polylepis.1